MSGSLDCAGRDLFEPGVEVCRWFDTYALCVSKCFLVQLVSCVNLSRCIIGQQ